VDLAEIAKRSGCIEGDLERSTWILDARVEPTVPGTRIAGCDGVRVTREGPSDRIANADRLRVGLECKVHRLDGHGRRIDRPHREHDETRDGDGTGGETARQTGRRAMNIHRLLIRRNADGWICNVSETSAARPSYRWIPD
jgi:hypothetical protein